MRKLCGGSILARRLQLPQHHPWLAECRGKVIAYVAEEDAYNLELKDDLEEWETDWVPHHEAADQLRQFPGTAPDADFVIASAYDLLDSPGSPAKAIARTGFSQPSTEHIRE
jgi:hypothetical protein